MKIYKYHFQRHGSGYIKVPFGSTLLSIGTDLDGIPCMWRLVDTTIEDFTRVYCAVVWTGEEPPANMTYVGTVTGDLIYHIYIA